ncbi:hypothetical protein CTP10_R54970 [Cupriavidus sp. P-10]|nr:MULTISPECIES: hypothetical protein [unclassified Cupriavidus]BDB28086.1 hypothetical protein CTP10_R54970 [Cupriavidus sp. P-10]
MQHPHLASAHPPRSRRGAIPATPTCPRQPGAGARYTARTPRA